MGYPLWTPPSTQLLVLAPPPFLPPLLCTPPPPTLQMRHFQKASGQMPTTHLQRERGEERGGGRREMANYYIPTPQPFWALPGGENKEEMLQIPLFGGGGENRSPFPLRVPAETAPAVAVAAAAPAPASKAPAKKAKKAGAAKARKPSGPSVTELITKAVAASKERKGVSLAALKKALAAGGYDVEKNNSRIKLGLKSLVNKGTLVHTKGIGASGSFKLGKKSSDSKEKAPKKKPVKPKKPVAKKAAGAVKKPKKPVAAKKSPKKPKKPAAAKKAAKSPKKAKPVKPKKVAKSPAKAKAVKPKTAKAKTAKPKAAKSKKAAPKKK